MQAEAKLYFLLNMFRMLVHSSSGACDCVWVYFSGSMCVGVTVWFGWGDVVTLCRLGHYCVLDLNCYRNRAIRISRPSIIRLLFVGVG